MDFLPALFTCKLTAQLRSVLCGLQVWLWGQRFRRVLAQIEGLLAQFRAGTLPVVSHATATPHPKPVADRIRHASDHAGRRQRAGVRAMAHACVTPRAVRPSHPCRMHLLPAPRQLAPLHRAIIRRTPPFFAKRRSRLT